MFAIAFDMNITNLRKYYGEPYNNAYFEIKNCYAHVISTTHKAVCT